QARNEIRDRLFGVSNMVKHCTSRDNVKTPRHHWPGHDISLAPLQIRQAHVDYGKIEIDGYCSSIRSDLPGKPRGNRHVAAADFQGSCAWFNEIKRLKYRAMN